jgi:hypothetical protein
MVACMCNKHSCKLLLLVHDLFLMHLNFLEYGDKIDVCVVCHIEVLNVN